MKEKLEEVTQLRKKSAQLEVMVGQLKEELAPGFEDAMARVACVHPRVDLSQTGLTKRVVDGRLVDAE
ncbi:hypothetical protein ACSQ67_025668 [Phaseolus vulgaris]